MLATIKTYFVISYSILLKLLSRLSLWRLFGAKIGFAAALAPAIGFFSGASTCIGVFLLRTLFSLTSSLSLLTGILYLPTLAGSLVLSTQSRILQIGIALVCMALFLLHPVGSQSWLYTLYWLIPIGISVLPKSSIFLRSLSSTFITHAVGSVLFLYTHPTTSYFWHALIAHVWLERLAYALILTVSYYVVTLSIHHINQLRFESSLCQNRSLSL